MLDRHDNPKNIDVPSPLPGFESEFMQELQTLAADLPVGVARLVISRVPGHPDWPEPYFELVPTNPKAARLSGCAVVTDLDLTVGEAAWREFVGFAEGGTVVNGATWQQELRWIWLAIVTGGFTEHVYRDSLGRAIGSTTILDVNKNELLIRNGRRAEKLFGRENVASITYEPYIRA
jgi:hypothetical protein